MNPLIAQLKRAAGSPGADITAAVRRGDLVVTLSGLWDRVVRNAGGLLAAGVQPGDRVVLRLPNGPDLTAAWLATGYVGGIAVPIPMALRDREVAGIGADATPAIAVTIGPDLEWLMEVLATGGQACRCLTVGETEHASAARLEDFATGASAGEPYGSSADDVTTILYTVDVTGKYRGACHSAAAMIAAADAYARGVLQMSPADVVSGHPPMTMAYGLGALLVFPLVTGAQVVLTGGFDADVLLSLIARERVTIFFGTATAYRLLLRIPDLTGKYDLRSLRVAVSAGEPLDTATSSEWQRRTGVDLVDGLGTTELFHIVVSQRPGAIVHGSLGMPVPAYEARVVDGRFDDVTGETTGALAIRGPSRCRVWSSAGVASGVDRDAWTLTGDLVRRDANGHYWFVRRADELIVSAGYNIAPREVEGVLMTHPAVAAARVVSVPDATRGAVPKALIVAKPDEEAGTALALSLQSHVQRALASYKAPRQIEFVPELPGPRDF